MEKLQVGKVTKTYEVKRLNEEGESVMTGIVAGYLATYDVDRIGDRFMPGAFRETIEDLKGRDRPLRLLRQHDPDRLIGGFKPDSLVEDERGLYGEAEINLAVQDGREAYMLAKQGVLSDFSVGFSVDPENDVEMQEGIRVFRRATLWETSLVNEPMNPAARVMEVRAITPIEKMPADMADLKRDFDEGNAMERMREFAGCGDEPNDKYRSGFLAVDQERPQEFTACKMPIADVVENRMVVIPRAVFMARAKMDGHAGGVDLSDQERDEAKRVINRLYARMGLSEPYGDDEEKAWALVELQGLPKGVTTAILRREAPGISRRAVDAFVDSFSATTGSEEDTSGVTEALQSMREAKAVAELRQTLKGAWK